MTALDEAIAGGRGTAALVTRVATLVDRSAGRLRRRAAGRGAEAAPLEHLTDHGTASRRGFLLGAAVVGSALAVAPRRYALRPGTAYGTICGPGNTARSGWSAFCATINKGVNACPPGSFAAGWWKASGSSWCGGGYRYIIDCNTTCTRCSTGCSDHICDTACWNCHCGHGPAASCDQRRVCCNAFRYGQCNTQVRCSGGVQCRMVSCTPPYRWANCSTTAFTDNRTAEHGSPALPVWGPIQAYYTRTGGQASFLKASASPVRTVPDRRGSYVLYQGGAIYHTATTGPARITTAVQVVYAAAGGPQGPLRYPTGERLTGLAGGGWLQRFEGGAVAASPSTAPQAVAAAIWTAWVAAGREGGVLRYPTEPARQDARGGHQVFQGGQLWALAGKPGYLVRGGVLAAWQAAGGASGRYGYPVENPVPAADGTLSGRFEGGVITA